MLVIILLYHIVFLHDFQCWCILKLVMYSSEIILMMMLIGILMSMSFSGFISGEGIISGFSLVLGFIPKSLSSCFNFSFLFKKKINLL